MRAGQPKVVDLSTAATLSQFGEIFKGRRATQRGTHSAAGRPVWPNAQDTPHGARRAHRFAGDHAFTGQGVPESFKFTLPPAQDIMPPIALQQAQVDGVTQLSWQALPHGTRIFHRRDGRQGRRRRARQR